jgi:hypothetical protein
MSVPSRKATVVPRRRKPHLLPWLRGSCGSGGSGAGFTFEDKSVELLVPPSAGTGKRWPLVLALHGDEGTNAAILSMWRPFWEGRKDFILLAPSWDGSWWVRYPEPKPFMERLLDKVLSEYDVDIDRIYATGVSGAPPSSAPSRPSTRSSSPPSSSTAGAPARRRTTSRRCPSASSARASSSPPTTS